MGFAKVQVCVDNDLKLNPPGKMCAPAGTKHLPGGMQRSQSNPNRAMVCPGGPSDLEQRRLGARNRRYQDDMRSTWTLNSSISSGSWDDASLTIRPTTSTSDPMPGGGRKQGAVIDVRPSSTGTIGYNPAKHSWCHPLGRAEYARLGGLTSKPTTEPGSWAWTCLKARDHNGYGDDGMVTWGDVQNTVVSEDAPAWLVGTRSCPGPCGTKKFPVRRCPLVTLEGHEVRVQAKTYKQGPYLDTMEILHDSAVPPAVVRARAQAPRKKYPLDGCDFNQAKMNNFEYSGMAGGCQTKNPAFPPSAMVTFETHDPRVRR